MQQSIDFQSPVVDKQINAYIALGVIVVNVPKESIQIHWTSIIEKQITFWTTKVWEGMAVGGHTAWITESAIHNFLAMTFEVKTKKIRLPFCDAQNKVSAVHDV